MTAATIEALEPSWKRALLAQNKAPRTITTYLRATTDLARYLQSNGLASNLDAITHEVVEQYQVDLMSTHKPSSVTLAFRSLQAFWKWAVDEGETESSPLARLRPPANPANDTPPPVVTDEQLARLLKTCEGREFAQRRDMAIIRLLIDTGMRRAECAGIRWPEDVDLDQNTVTVMGKGRRTRVCPFGRKTAQALDRYLRVRSSHKDAGLPWLWLGLRGKVTGDGVENIVTRHAKEARLDGIHPHLFRHTFAHQWLSQGGQEGDLMRLAGWRSRTMIGRYGASAADERARDAHKRMALGDRV